MGNVHLVSIPEVVSMRIKLPDMCVSVLQKYVQGINASHSQLNQRPSIPNPPPQNFCPVPGCNLRFNRRGDLIRHRRNDDR